MIRTMFLSGRGIPCLVLMASLAVLAGCKEMKVAPVSGTITLDGEPLKKASVRFQPMGGGRPSMGFTDDNGRYELDYSMREAGAEVGQCQVFLSTGGGGDYNDDGEMVAQSAKDQVPRKYRNDPPVVDVEPKRNVIDIALTSAD